ncbi:hypothetical protein N0V83_005354 [Neocucurbitaria cava]|uniref:Uncharacterized protein n=1 Tax=Neocucurbitaria cava TaxID=798079 RepID=A0A9W8Y779_9PLEO|nr:hypothetical protein N0V83_005354 [Neocucurbitaria cava]
MAVTLKRKRGAVSYKEPSSEEDFSETSGEERTIRRRKRPTPSRRSTRHQQVDDEDESSSQQASPQARPTRNPRNVPRTSRSHGRQKISYKDISSDEEEDDPDADFEVEEVQTPRKTARAAAVRSPRPPRSLDSKRRQRRKLALGAPLKPNNAVVGSEGKAAEIPTDGHKPAWQSLPYHVLLQIFVYAAHPLHDENMKPTTSIPWLVQVARMCSTFTKPALTALYRNPPIFATRQTRKDLVHHLITPPSDAHEDYRVMVKRLELDATQMSALTDQAHSVADLAALVQSLTTLREIDIFDPIDRPPFRDRLRRLRRWVYPTELFEALRQTQLRLRTWRWNRTFCNDGPLWMKTIHGDAAFQTLRELTLTKFHPEPSHEEREKREDLQGQPTTEELLASALVVLPRLRSLSFETCGVVSGRLLPLLPSNLISLNITNCGELLSDALQAFLATHGAQLEELVLHHNQSLSLSFLVDLKRSCPKLEILRMDTIYYSSLAMSSDNEPLYDTLLGVNEAPSWPSSLRVIDMENLRNWNSTSATNFFSSLIEAAEELPWLREITIQAMVDTDWRQRAEFRMKWMAKFEKVFARKWVEPDPHLVSLRAFREWQEHSKNEGKSDSFIEGLPTHTPNGIEVAKTAPDSDSDAPLLRSREQKGDDRWGSKRLRLRSKAATSYDESSGSEIDSGDAQATSDDDDNIFVQGRCHTVMFRVDNFRPREEVYNEGDFLDAEPSGDEEWNGNEDNEDEGGYAW